MIEGKIAGKPVHFEARQPVAEPGRIVPALAALSASPVAAVRRNEASPEGGMPNPLAAVEIVHGLIERARALDTEPFFSSDFPEFARQRLMLRGSNASPMFDPAVGRLQDKAFWLGARNKQGEVVSLQAYRLDYVDTSLAEWVVGWMAGLYLKRHELMVPAYLEPPSYSRAGRVRGRLVYHGEIWLSPNSEKPQLFRYDAVSRHAACLSQMVPGCDLGPGKRPDGQSRSCHAHEIPPSRTKLPQMAALPRGHSQQ